MKGKILLLTGVAVGYVLGTRAGREKYEQIKTQVSKLWEDPRVQKQVHVVEDFAKDKASDAVDAATDGVKKGVSKLSGKSSSSASSSTASTPSSSTAG
jgi:hypothetical protein